MDNKPAQNIQDTFLNTVRKDTSKSFEQAIIEIYRRMRPGDPPTLESAKALFEGMFFDARKYDFSRVGRFKFNIKLDLDSPVTQKTMSAGDFFVVINYLLRLRKDVFDDLYAFKAERGFPTWEATLEELLRRRTAEAESETWTR